MRKRLYKQRKQTALNGRGGSCFSAFPCLSGRQNDREGAAYPRYAFNPDGAFVLLSNPFGNGKPQARAAAFPSPCLVDAVEAIEDPWQVLFFNPLAGVGDFHAYSMARRFGLDQRASDIRAAYMGAAGILVLLNLIVSLPMSLVAGRGISAFLLRLGNMYLSGFEVPTSLCILCGAAGAFLAAHPPRAFVNGEGSAERLWYPDGCEGD